jgi:High potential iron-sulfur protein
LLQIKAFGRKIIQHQTIIVRAGCFAMTDRSGISRRRILTVAAGAAGAVSGMAAIVGASTPAQAAKASQKSVKYQDTPKGEARCENCALFEAPSSCKTVDGTVSPDGWCMVYAKKPA